MIRKRKKPRGVTVVYQVKYLDVVVYIGRTNNLLRRQKEHNRCLNNGDKKALYLFLQSKGVDEIILEPVAENLKLVDAKRMEMLLILQDYFGEKNLKQKVPNISDR